MSNIWNIEYASGESSGTVGKTFPRDPDGTSTTAKWFQCVGPGTVVAPCEGSTQVLTAHVSGGEIIKGSFTSLTSTTCTYLRMGNGPPPSPTVTGASPGTISAQGTVALSVAPVAAANPIAVGNNDTRVTTVTVPIILSGTDGTLAETIVWRAPIACTITGAYINSSVAMTASNTDYDTFTLQNRPLATPTVPAVLIATSTKAADLNALVAWVEESLGTLSNTSMLLGDILAFKSVIGGAGKASGPALLRVTYTVP